MSSLIQNRAGKISQRGFSLFELALVMGVIGAILAALWGLISTGRLNSLVEQTSGQITVVAANVRGFYSGQLGMPNQGYGAITSNLLNSNIAAIPAYMQRQNGTGCTNPGNACADTVWGPDSYNGGSLQTDPSGTFRVCNWWASTCNNAAPGTVSPYFGIMLTGLSEEVCERLVTRVSYSGAKGLTEVSINGTALASQGKSVEPVSATDARAYCPPGALVTTSVVFVYSVITPP